MTTIKKSFFRSYHGIDIFVTVLTITLIAWSGFALIKISKLADNIKECKKTGFPGSLSLSGGLLMTMMAIALLGIITRNLEKLIPLQTLLLFTYFGTSAIISALSFSESVQVGCEKYISYGQLHLIPLGGVFGCWVCLPLWLMAR